ncbi:type IV pilus assembly protein PilM [Microbacterium sp. STN6]|uniref:type IV pilus assembly protein PilM n=1 Tax=Microbacterium sp. STN6 TaxID=2995588 RepID=UPI002260915C|nr:type IV pilus assembly protein PilM [Microbacterium sp. STN6]MCX7523190.1 type IV pilus assembly protein PilM [Microbacterium sp. STN6]
MAQSIVGVDIGSSTVRAAEVRRSGRGRQTLVGFFEVPLPEGAVSRGEVLEPNTVAAALKQLWAKGRFRSKNVVLGMGNQRVLARDVSVPSMPIERIRESLPFHVQELLPVPVADALLDFYPISETQGENGLMANGLLIAAVKDAVLGNIKAVQLAGLTPVDVDLIPFAITRALLQRDEIEGTTAVIEIGANTTSVVIAQKGVPQFVRIIPAGGDDLTAALRDRLEIEHAEAEKLKRMRGLNTTVTSDLDRRHAEIIFQVTSELLNSLRNTINYFMNTRPQNPVAQIVLTGGGAKLEGLPDALGELTRIPVLMADPFTSIGLGRSLRADELRASQSALTVSLGLALGSAA